MATESSEPRKTSWGSLDGAGKLLAVLAAAASVSSAVVGVFAAQTKTELDRLQSKVNRLQNERSYATEIYTRFDAIVTSKADPEERVARLNGLLALTELVDTDQLVLKQRLASLIENQSRSYRAVVESKATPGSEIQIAQFRELEKRAAKVARTYQWGSYNVDVLWCRGAGRDEAAEALAGRILKLKAADPSATGRWRARPFTAKPGTYGIFYDYADEKPIAEALQALLQVQAIPDAATSFYIGVPAKVSTPHYVSLLVCPT